jgi:hypothetical protein
MPEITHVCEIRFRDLTDTQAAMIETLIRHTLHHDVYNAEVHFGPVGLPAKWKPAAQDDMPSLKQRNYFRRLVDELDMAIKCCNSGAPLAQEKFVLQVASDDLKDPALTRRRISELIDTVKETIDDVNFIRTGPRAPA